jgi:hypothetical protein
MIDESFLSMSANTASVEYYYFRLIKVINGLMAPGAQDAGHDLRVSLIHLAAEGLDIESHFGDLED